MVQSKREVPHCDDKVCPKGQYAPKSGKCEPCPTGHFTATANCLQKCLPCKTCLSKYNFVSMSECTPERDRQCKCQDDYHCINEACEHCKPLTQCPSGEGVKRPPSPFADNECVKCPRGTFNNVLDSSTPCLNHTNCASNGWEESSPGTAHSDTKCAPIQRCHWILPASLWAGIVVTVVIIFIGYLCRRTRRRTMIPVRHSEIKINTSVPDLPNILHSTMCDEENHSDRNPYCTGQLNNFTLPCDLVCDGIAKSEDKKGNNIPTGLYSSEPQEDEWSET